VYNGAFLVYNYLMINKVTDETTTERVFDDSYEAPYSYEADEEMLEVLERRFVFDTWTNQVQEESR
jgi:hypothetical protein